MLRTYKLKHQINKGKQDKIIAVVQEYRQLAVTIAHHQWRLLFENGKMDRDADIKDIETPLSARYKQTCQYQVVGVLQSFLSNRQNDFVKIVWNSSLDSETKKTLFFINKHKLWFAKEVQMPSFGKNDSKPEDKSLSIKKTILDLARSIFKHVLEKHRKPSLDHCNLALDHKVAQISAVLETEKHHAKQFDFWVTLATLDKGQPIYLPIVSNDFFDDKLGQLRKFCQINLSKDNTLQVCFIKDVEVPDAYTPKTSSIALDFGLTNLFTSNQGDIFSRNFHRKLLRYDKLISKIAQNRQRQNLPIKSPRYNRAVRKLRCFLKNEINRVINRIVEVSQPKEIIIERLNFSSPKLSKVLNRLLSIFGKKIIQQKFNDITEKFGIVITEVPAAYTSQTCSNCGYVAPDNRVSQSEFICKFCHSRLHADVNAARNILARSSCPKKLHIYLRKSEILSLLVIQFIKRFPRAYSCARCLLLENPYFRDFCSSTNLGYT